MDNSIYDWFFLCGIGYIYIYTYVYTYVHIQSLRKSNNKWKITNGFWMFLFYVRFSHSVIPVTQLVVSTMWGPLVITWFINPSNYSYKYHKP